MSIAHQLRQQRRNAAQERRSLVLGSTILGGCVLAVIGVAGLVVAQRGLAAEHEEFAAVDELKATTAVQRGSRLQTADANNAFLQQCKRNMMIGGLGAMVIGSPQLQGERGREIGRQMIDGSMCEQAFETMRQMQGLQRKVNRPSSDDE